MDCMGRQPEPLQMITQTKTLTHISLHKHTHISFFFNRHTVYFSYIQYIYHLFSFILLYFFHILIFPLSYLTIHPPRLPTPHSPFFLLYQSSLLCELPELHIAILYILYMYANIYLQCSANYFNSHTSKVLCSFMKNL